MRVQRLAITAFGPFAAPVDLDFEILNQGGLFLLTGANGAGKSSVLDAICFALYGDVPGERSTAKRLRADHADPGVAPRVELEATFGDGTYRLVRTAAWERPKKRGTGTTLQQATVSVSRLEDGGWVPVTTRIDEAGQLVTRLVGMTFTQFCQVVVLPQGRFQAFLHAGSQERLALLQQLFHTERFRRVEMWLRDHRLALRRASLEHAQGILDVLHRISESAGETVPESVLDEHAADEERVSWVTGILERSTSAAAEALARAECSAAAEEAARAQLDAAREIAELQRRHREARTELDALEEAEPEVATARLRLDRASRAGVVRPLAEQVVDHEAAATRATERAAAAWTRLCELSGEPAADLAATLDAWRAEVARLRALLPRVQETARLRSALTAGREAAEHARARLAALEESTGPADLRATEDDATAVAEAAAALPDVEERLASAADLVRAHATLGETERALAEAVRELDAAHVRVLDAKETWLHIREARIAGMAAELAGALAVGHDCPVCGSVEHPRPAASLPGAPDADAERAAERAHTDALAVHEAHRDLVRHLAHDVESLRGRLGDVTQAEALTRHDEALRCLDEVRARAARQDQVAVRLGEARARVQAEDSERQDLSRRLASLDALTSEQSRVLAGLEGELAGALAVDLTRVEDLHALLAEALDEAGLRVTAAELAQTARLDAEQAARSLAESERRLAEAAREAGFDEPGDAVAALLGPEEADRLTQSVRDHAERLAAVRRVLADPDLTAAASAEPADIPALVRAHETAVAEARAAAARRASAEDRVRRLTELADRLRRLLSAWRPVRERLEVATGLAAFCEGKSPDNRAQMALSAYVVAWRLAQVAEAANLRLAVLTHGRYTVEHTDERAAGERRGGLGLVVRDQWTGSTRDPRTLSGGETFVVALALALGLADVITAEAGGATLQTLFVDEGFGSLDAATLDLVMDALDSLRESGRVVGVVSHVAEMRDRIPVQLRVIASETGSRLQPVG